MERQWESDLVLSMRSMNLQLEKLQGLLFMFALAVLGESRK